MYFIDPKSEFSSLSEFYPLERIQEILTILKLLKARVRDELKTTKNRQLKLSKNSKKSACVVMISGTARLSSSLMKSVVAVWTASRKKSFWLLTQNKVQKRAVLSVFVSATPVKRN